MRIYMLIYLVRIIIFNSWYKHGAGKNSFYILHLSLWITLIEMSTNAHKTMAINLQQKMKI